MATKTDTSVILSECCDAKDLVRQKIGILTLVLSDDCFVCRFILGNSAPVDMDSSIPDYGYRLPYECVSMR